LQLAQQKLADQLQSQDIQAIEQAVNSLKCIVMLLLRYV
jgi:hypothetical protein